MDLRRHRVRGSMVLDAEASKGMARARRLAAEGRCILRTWSRYLKDKEEGVNELRMMAKRRVHEEDWAGVFITSCSLTDDGVHG